MNLDFISLLVTDKKILIFYLLFTSTFYSSIIWWNLIGMQYEASVGIVFIVSNFGIFSYILVRTLLIITILGIFDFLRRKDSKYFNLLKNILLILATYDVLTNLELWSGILVVK